MTLTKNEIKYNKSNQVFRKQRNFLKGTTEKSISQKEGLLIRSLLTAGLLLMTSVLTLFTKASWHPYD